MIKKTLRLFSLNLARLALLMFILISCQKYDANGANEPLLPPIQNRPLPVNANRLRVLAIGNSYTIDGTEHISKILNAAGVSDTTYCIYAALQGGASLTDWYNHAVSQDQIELELRAGKYGMPQTTGTLQQLIAQDWDVIVLQQVSLQALNYDTYNPSLRYLTDMILQYCENPSVSIAWQMIWAYKESYGNAPRGYERWAYNVAATQEMMLRDDIDIIIPSGTAIQNARTTELQTEGELTRDGTHLDIGVGRWIAACTWVQTLFSPVYGITIEGNQATYDVPDIINSQFQYWSSSVTDSNKSLCQQCAINAVLHPFEIKQPE